MADRGELLRESVRKQQAMAERIRQEAERLRAERAAKAAEDARVLERRGR
jgi:hypothetical protein